MTKNTQVSIEGRAEQEQGFVLTVLGGLCSIAQVQPQAPTGGSAEASKFKAPNIGAVAGDKSPHSTHPEHLAPAPNRGAAKM